MINNFKNLNNRIIKCNYCPRLVKFRKKIASKKRKQYINQNYWGKPINGFGDSKAKILFVGLAPAAHGGNRTGRVFTGDKSSDFRNEISKYKINLQIFFINVFIKQIYQINPILLI